MGPSQVKERKIPDILALSIGKKKQKFNLRVYWLFFILSICYLAFGNLNTEGLFWPIFFALFVGGWALSLSGYRWMSVVSIFSLAHIVQFPVAALLTLSLPYPSLAIEQKLWSSTAISMWAMVLAMSGFISGVLMSRIFRFSSKKKKIKTSWETPVSLNFLITLACLPVLLINITSGVYFHILVDSNYNFDFANSMGFVGYLTYLSYVGCVLQLKRFSQTKSRKDFIYSILLTLFIFLATAPSGSRRSGMIIFLIWGLYLFDNREISKRLKVYFFYFGLIFSFLLLPQLEFYRNIEESGSSIVDKISHFSHYVFFLNVLEDGNYTWVTYKAIIARRLADYVSVSYIIDNIPQNFGFRGFSDIIQWPYYLLPTLIRPETDLSFVYDAILMVDLQFRTDFGGGAFGSSPAMLIGDLYSRGGWIAVWIGMLILGCILGKLDRYLLKGSFRTTVLWVLFFDYISMFHALNLLRIFTTFTRHFLIYYMIAIFLEIAIEQKRKKAIYSQS
jgi:hypothetical protein